MKAPAFDYVRAATVEEALAALAAADGGGRILAGGQSLVPMLNLRLAFAEVLVDIGGIADLAGARDEGQDVWLGCRTTHAAIEDGRVGDHWNGMLGFVARDIAYRAVRNRGTVGGSLAHADPAADWPVALAALGARVCIAGPEGERLVPCEEFVLDTFTTALDEGEMVVGVRVPKLSESARWRYLKVRKKAGAFADAIAAFVSDPVRGEVRVVVGSADAGGPRRLPSLEEMLSGGQRPGKEAIADAVDELLPDLERYDRQIHLVALGRTLSEMGG